MRAVALSEDDRRIAVVTWIGLFVGGPILPVILLIITWARRGSLARRHATAACLMWLVLLGIWVPVVVSQLMLSTTEPGAWVVALAAALFAIALLCSITGLIRALRAQVVPPDPPPGVG